MTQDRKTKQKCPYCYSDIPVEAEVCKHCARDVGRLIKAETRIKELELLLSQNQEQPDIIAPASTPSANNWQWRIPIAFFYVISIFYPVISLFENVIFDVIIVFIVAITAGFLATNFSKNLNYWTLFIMGFIQPVLEFMLSLLLVAEFAEIKSKMGNLFQNGIEYGLSIMFGGILFDLFKKSFSMQSFSLTPFFEWFETANSNLDRIEKFILKLASLAGVIIPLISIFQ